MFGRHLVAPSLVAVSIFLSNQAGTLKVIKMVSESRRPINGRTIPALLVAHLESPPLMSATFFEEPMAFSSRFGFISKDYWQEIWGPRGITVARDEVAQSAVVDFGNVLSDELIELFVDFADRFVEQRFVRPNRRADLLDWLEKKTVAQAFLLKQALQDIFECGVLALAIEECSAELAEQEQVRMTLAAIGQGLVALERQAGHRQRRKKH